MYYALKKVTREASRECYILVMLYRAYTHEYQDEEEQ